jgi:hypothetical protein
MVVSQYPAALRVFVTRGNQAKGNVIKAALLPLLGNDRAEVERVFLIIKAQQEY